MVNLSVGNIVIVQCFMRKGNVIPLSIIFNCSRERYTYSYRSAGSHHVEKMKKLAINGIGLNSYILTIVKYDFEKY